MITVEDLKRMPTLSAFTADDCAVLLRQARVRTLKKGDVLYTQGEPARACFLLVRGVVEVERVRGNGHHVISTVRPGLFIGQVSLMDRGDRTATVRAAVECEGIELARPDFDSYLAGSTSLCLAFQDHVAVAGIRQFRGVMTRLAAIPPKTAAPRTIERREKQLAQMQGALGEWGTDPEEVGDIEVVIDKEVGRNWKRRQ